MNKKSSVDMSSEISIKFKTERLRKLYLLFKKLMVIKLFIVLSNKNIFTMYLLFKILHLSKISKNINKKLKHR